IRAHLGWPVVAFESGKIRTTGFKGAAGIMVEIEQIDGKFSRYAHLQTTTVNEGETVKKGDKIGEVGCTGRTTGAHLHFSLYTQDHVAIDPMKYLVAAEEVLRPKPEDIPDKLGPQQCNGSYAPYVPAMSNYRHSNKYGRRHGVLVIRSRSGKTIRVDLNSLRNYKPPEIPLWNSRQRLRRR
ncbi:MAG: M23 family metallopeptidase, partial [Desulfovibrionaceae bacterium]|nr:M23 family metallopeptidase [Desulfovibrionaceae bacterium]